MGRVGAERQEPGTCVQLIVQSVRGNAKYLKDLVMQIRDLRSLPLFLHLHIEKKILD